MAEKPARRTSLIRLAISVEGQTEEEFVKQVLAGHLRTKGVEPTPILLGRARGRFGGGNVSVDRLAPEMIHLLHSFDVVTSLVDLYGFRGRGSMNREELEQHIHEAVVRKMNLSRNQSGIFPYVQQYEFEGLLFSEVETFEKAITTIEIPKESIEKLRRIREQFPTPEDINDNPETAPSKRIMQLIPRYIKRVHGPLLAEETGLETIRAECPLFDGWVKRLESLGNPTESG